MHRLLITFIALISKWLVFWGKYCLKVVFLDMFMEVIVFLVDPYYLSTTILNAYIYIHTYTTR